MDRLSAKDRLWYMSSAICCTLLPLHLYINVLDLELASSQLILAVGCCGASVIGLFRFYHEAAKMKKHACAPPPLPRPAPRPLRRLTAPGAQAARRSADLGAVEVGQDSHAGGQQRHQPEGGVLLAVLQQRVRAPHRPLRPLRRSCAALGALSPLRAAALSREFAWRRIYLFAMAFFGFYFLRGQSLEVNYVTSLLITMAIMFFANQEL